VRYGAAVPSSSDPKEELTMSTTADPSASRSRGAGNVFAILGLIVFIVAVIVVGGIATANMARPTPSSTDAPEEGTAVETVSDTTAVTDLDIETLLASMGGSSATFEASPEARAAYLTAVQPIATGLGVEWSDGVSALFSQMGDSVCIQAEATGWSSESILTMTQIVYDESFTDLPTEQRDAALAFLGAALAHLCPQD